MPCVLVTSVGSVAFPDGSSYRFEDVNLGFVIADNIGLLSLFVPFSLVAVPFNF